MTTERARRGSLVMTVAAAMALSGCSAVQASREVRGRAMDEQVDRIAAALSALDVGAIEDLTCKEPWLVQVPLSSPSPEPPLYVKVLDVEPLSLDGSTYQDPDPGAEFHIASFQGSSGDPEFAEHVYVDAVVRVDEHGACLWALGAPFAVLLGL